VRQVQVDEELLDKAKARRRKVRAVSGSVGGAARDMRLAAPGAV